MAAKPFVLQGKARLIHKRAIVPRAEPQVPGRENLKPPPLTRDGQKKIQNANLTNPIGLPSDSRKVVPFATGRRFF